MTLRMYRLSKKFLLATAALPLFQMTSSCDPLALSNAIGSELIQNFAFGVFGSIVRGSQATLLTFFPSADLLQLFLGGNNTQFFTG